MESTKKMKEQAENQNAEQKAKTAKQESNEQQAASGIAEVGQRLTERGSEIAGQAKEVATDVYNRASQGLNQGYQQAMDYGRENPGKTTLIAFGAGLGVGLLLAGALTPPSRTRASRVVPPIMNALSDIATELFRR